MLRARLATLSKPASGYCCLSSNTTCARSRALPASSFEPRPRVFLGQRSPCEKSSTPLGVPRAILIHSRGGDEEMYIVETLAKNRRLYPGEGKGCKTIGGN